MEWSEFIERERELGIQKIGRRVHISRGKPMMIISRGPNERAQSYQQQPISSSLFSKVLVSEGSPPIWEKLPKEVHRECIIEKPAINTGRQWSKTR